MNLNWKGALLASALLAAGSVPLTAGVLYTQPYDGSGSLCASQNDTGGSGNFATVYDNFTLGGNSIINEVAWTGGYFNPGPPGNITQFTVTFWADNAGQPGGSLKSSAIAGNAGETVSGNAYTYDMTLTQPFAAAAGTQYWLSVEPDMGFPPQWGWATSAVGDSVSYQDFLGGRTQNGFDMAFTLSGTSGVPEPVSFSLAGIGLGLVGLASWKRRKHTA
jgi:hypothetical protein